MRDDLELQAMPGRKLARADAPDEWIVSAIAGRVGALGKQPSIPIASFFGPQAEHDAHLFAGAASLYLAVQALELLTHQLVDTATAATSGALNLTDDPEVAHMLCMAKAVRMVSCGIAAACVSFAHNGMVFNAKMPLHEIMELSTREGVYLATIDRAYHTPLSDQGAVVPQTIGEATDAAPLASHDPASDDQPGATHARPEMPPLIN